MRCGRNVLFVRTFTSSCSAAVPKRSKMLKDSMDVQPKSSSHRRKLTSVVADGSNIRVNVDSESTEFSAGASSTREIPLSNLPTGLPDWDRGGRTDKTSLTPLYASMKKLIVSNPGCVCLIQVGSFYELYFEQAEVYAPKLGLKVAFRKTNNYTIPMAGFPVFQLQKFVRILVQEVQVNVAIIDQYPNQKLDSSNIIHRKISRIISPGTLVDETFLNYQQNNYLLAISLPPNCTKVPVDPDCKIGISWIDLSVGEFYVQQTTISDLLSDVARINPSEIILPKEFQDDNLPDGKWYPTFQEFRKYFLRYHQTNYSHLKLKFQSDLRVTRKALESFSVREEAAMNMVLSYINVNLPEADLSLDIPSQFWNEKYLQMDSRTRDALELTHRVNGGRSSVIGSLLTTIKKTVTSSGTRLLTQWIKSPILDVEQLQYRQEFVKLFLDNSFIQSSLRLQLSKIEDCARSIQKLSIGSGDVINHLFSIADSLSKLHLLERFLFEAYSNNPQNCKILKDFLDDYKVPINTAEEILNTLHVESSETNLVENEGENLIQEEEEENELFESGSYGNSSIAKYRTTKRKDETPSFRFSIRKDYNDTLSNLHNQLEELKEQEQISIEELKNEISHVDSKFGISKKSQHGRHQNVLYISGKTKSIEDLAKVLGDGVREKRKSSIIYKPHKWSNLQVLMENIIDSINTEESRIIGALRNKILDQVIEIRKIGKLTDFLDVTSSFAVLAGENQLVRPKFVKKSQIKIEGGRHLVVESGLKQIGKMFQPNDTNIGSSSGNLWLISGPNMGGKSTFLRQNALIVILAQIGSYVPAERVSIGVVDRIFTRIGASDDLFSDLSTFMVEMVETSAILKHATPRSLAIVDEIGRGTSGKEGLAIAYATLINLLQVNKCRTLFATHFGKELESLMIKNKINQKKIRYYRTRVLNPNQDILNEHHNLDLDLIIDHKLEPGISERSCALRVAQMAGFPEKALADAISALKVLG